MSRTCRLPAAPSGKPRVPWRVAMLPATTHFGRHFRPDLFYDTLAELPRLGMNGVLIVPAKTHGTPAGLGPLPLHVDAEPVVGTTPAQITVAPGALNVVLPPKLPSHLLVKEEQA